MQGVAKLGLARKPRMWQRDDEGTLLRSTYDERSPFASRPQRLWFHRAHNPGP